MKNSGASRPLSQYTREVVYATSPKGRSSKQSLIRISASVRSLLGYKSAEFEKDGDLWISIVHPEDQKMLAAAWRQTIGSGRGTVLEYRIKPKKKRDYVWVEDRLAVLRDSKGRKIGVTGSVIDVTGRKKLEHALTESEANLKNILDDAVIGMYRTTPDGRVLMANKAFLDMLGYRNSRDLSSVNLNEKGFQPGYPRKEFRRIIEKEGSVHGFEAVWIGKNGKTIFTRENAHVVRDSKGRVKYYEGTFEDISDRKRAEERTIRINRILRMASSVGQFIIHESNQNTLLARACETIVEEGGYRMAWIGLRDEKDRKVVPLVWSGRGTGYLKGVLLKAEARWEDEGPEGRAITSQTAWVCNEVDTDPSFEPWRDETIRRGFHSMGCFPMRVRGTVVGLLGVYSETRDRFGLGESHLLMELADNIGSALWAIEARIQQAAADEVIRDREFWLKESQRVAKVGSYIYEFGSGTWSCSAVLDEILGINADYERTFRSWVNLIHRDDRALLLSGVRRFTATQKQFSSEFRIVRLPDKEVRWMWGTGEVLRDAAGKPVRLFGTAQDITDRKLAEEALVQSESLFHTSFENSSTGIALLNLDGKFRKVNAKFSEMIGYSREEISNYKCRDLSFPDDAAVIDRLLADAFSGGPGSGISEERYIRKDGRIIWVEFSVSMVQDQGGQPEFLIANFNDITERKRAEEAFRNEHILLRTLIDNLPNSIYVKDVEYRKKLANSANVQHTGKKTESEVLGRTDFELYPRELAEKYYADDQEVIRDGKAILVTEEYSIGPEGDRRWQLTSKIPLRDKSGTIVGLIGIGTDITERKKSEENARRERILLRTILDHIPNAIFVKDKDYRKILVNPAHVERMNEHIGPHTEEELLGKTDFEICPRPLAEDYFREDRRVVQDGATMVNRPLSHVDLKGQRHWELISKIPMRNDKGDIIGLVGVSTDITALREVEEKLAESESKFRLLAENARDIVFRYGLVPAPHYEYISSSALDVVGYIPEEYYSDPDLIVKAIHPDDRVTLKELIDRIRKSEDPITLRWVRKDGTVIWVEILCRTVFDKKNKLVAIEGIVRDITERKESEDALRKSEETLARITGAISDIIYSVNGTTGEFEYLSPAFEKTLGYTQADIDRLGGRWPFLLSVIEGDHPGEKDPITNDMRQRPLTTIPVWERWWKCKDGTRRFIEDYSVPIYDGDRLIRVDGVLRDITDRKLAEDEVEKERILLRTLIDNFPYAIYVKDRNYRKVIANNVDVQHFAGLTSESEIIGKTDFDIYPAEIAERLLADDQRVILNGETIIGKEELVADAKGQEHWLMTTKVPLRDKENNIIGLVGVGIDVTAKRAVDEALRRSEAELRALFESMNDVIMVVDRDGRYLKVAPTDPSLLIRPADELTGKTLFDVLAEDKAAYFLRVIREVLGDRKTHSVEYTLEIGGREEWRAASVSPMTEDSVIWVARDVTERKTMENEIADSEKKYRELVENALVGVYKINLSGTVIYANKAMADMLEFVSPQEMMSVSLSSLYINAEEMADLVDELRAFGKTDKNKEVELVTKSGKVRNVLVSASLDRDVISGMAKDITEIRTLEREFIQTQKLEGLGNIAAGIAHDFNNILGVILGYSDLLEQSDYDENKFERGMQAITKSAERGKSLVRQLLTFARKTDVTFESVVLNDEVTEIQKLVEETFPKTIEVRIHLEKGLPPVLADATQIHQVLLNLCVNARDAMSEGGTLFLSTGVVTRASLSGVHPEALSDRYVEVQVGDTGMGMDESTRRRIFEPFFTTKGIGKGTGLGLSVVYGIVESHRGYIDVMSEPGGGTTFKIYIPVLDHNIGDADFGKVSAEKGQGRSATILVIEDEEMLRELLRSLLTSRGHRVVLAKDGEDGVNAYGKDPGAIDLVISDLGLPKLNGEEVVKRIKEIGGRAKLAIASGFISPEAKAGLEKEGVVNFIQKPYRTAEVIRVVDEMLSDGKV